MALYSSGAFFGNTRQVILTQFFSIEKDSFKYSDGSDRVGKEGYGLLDIASTDKAVNTGGEVQGSNFL